MSADPAVSDDALRVHLDVGDGADGAVVLVVGGEVDLLTAPLMTEAVTAAITRRPPVVVIDLAEVTFLDSSGLSILAGAHTSAPDGSQVRVVAPADGMPYRAMHLTGLDEILAVFPTRADALSQD